MKKLLILTMVIGTIFSVGCTTPSEKKTEKKTYYVNSCHYTTKDVKCVTEAFACTMDIQPSDFCSNLVKCSESGEIIKEPSYDACVDCFATGEKPTEACLEQFPGFKNFP